MALDDRAGLNFWALRVGAAISIVLDRGVVCPNLSRCTIATGYPFLGRGFVYATFRQEHFGLSFSVLSA